jgi:hypothetical protein
MRGDLGEGGNGDLWRAELKEEGSEAGGAATDKVVFGSAKVRF